MYIAISVHPANGCAVGSTVYVTVSHEQSWGPYWFEPQCSNSSGWSGGDCSRLKGNISSMCPNDSSFMNTVEKVYPCCFWFLDEQGTKSWLGTANLRGTRKNKENNLGKERKSRKLVEKQELGRSRFPVLGGRQEYVWGLCYRDPIVSKCVEE